VMPHVVRWSQKVPQKVCWHWLEENDDEKAGLEVNSCGVN